MTSPTAPLGDVAPAFVEMVTISRAIVAHKSAGLPYLVYLRHPTTGGVFASWGSLGHVTVAEPGAMIGFLGARVYEALYGRPFPEGVQVAENLHARGIIDAAADLTVVGEAADGSEALAVVRAAQPDVVLMDLSMPGVDGIEGTARLRDAGESARVVVLTSFVEHDRVTAALAAGAVGYLLKDSDPRDVLEAIRSAAAGHAPLDARVARALLPSSKPADPAAALSGREREVLLLVAQGMANKQIARELGIAQSTVKSHVGNIFGKLGLLSRTQVALYAARTGMVSP